VISDSSILKRYLQNLNIVLNLEGRQTPKIGEKKHQKKSDLIY
jgi:hypothetical protein